MKREDINIRDPFILPYEGKYYLYGSRGSEVWEDNATGLDVYVSEDLENWSEPKEIFTRTADFWADRHYWAPEVYAYNGAFYMFASFKSADRCRGTMVLKADKPDGKFTVHSEGTITPPDWESLDGTLYISKSGKPYMIFCHEWVQVNDGEMGAIEMSADLKRAVGEPILQTVGFLRHRKTKVYTLRTVRFRTDVLTVHYSCYGQVWAKKDIQRLLQCRITAT